MSKLTLVVKDDDALGFLHVYNLKYCTCEDDDCCTHK